MNIRNFLCSLVITVLTALCLSALLLSSCGGEGSDSNKLNTENVVERVSAALPNIKTYHTEMDMSIHIRGDMMDEKADMNMVMKGNGALDLDEHKAKLEMTMEARGDAAGEKISENNKIMTYILEDMVYVGTSRDSESMAWDHQSLPASAWDQQNQIEQQRKLLASSTVKYVKDETVQGTQCYVVELVPDLKTLWDTVMRQSGMMGNSMDIQSLQDAMKNVTASYWFEKDSLYFKKAYVEMKMEMTPEMIGESGEGQMNMDVEMTLLFDGYNQPVEILVPDIAKE